jgi:hypothetical protein
MALLEREAAQQMMQLAGLDELKSAQLRLHIEQARVDLAPFHDQAKRNRRRVKVVAGLLAAAALSSWFFLHTHSVQTTESGVARHSSALSEERSVEKTRPGELKLSKQLEQN